MSEVAQVPQLRFPEFNGAWEGSNIENISTLIQSGLSRLLNDSDIGIPVIRSSNISDNSLNIDDIKYWHLIDPQGANTSNYLLVENDLLINFINSMAQIGKACLYKNLLNRKVIFTTNLMRIQFSDNTIPEFVFYFFCTENYRRQLKAITMPAVNQASFTKKDFNKLQVHLPPKPEQEKIAAFLTTVDNKIEQLSKKQELLKEYKKGLMQQIFSQATRFKADDGCDFPDWEEKKLGDLIAEISDGGTPPTSNKGNFGGGINWVVIDDIRDEIRITKETLTETGLSNSSSKLWKPETIILSTGATIGRVGIAKIYTTTKQGVCGIVVNQFTSNLFLKYWFIFNINLLKRFSQGSSIKEVRPPTLIKFDISTPSLPEQTKIANFLSSIDSKIEQVGKQLDESKQFKKALLQQMFV